MMTTPEFESLEIELEVVVQDMLVEQFVNKHLLPESVAVFTHDIQQGVSVAEAVYHAIVNEGVIHALQLAVDQAQDAAINPTLQWD
jgi:hypothetical protein